MGLATFTVIKLLNEQSMADTFVPYSSLPLLPEEVLRYYDVINKLAEQKFKYKSERDQLKNENVHLRDEIRKLKCEQTQTVLWMQSH